MIFRTTKRTFRHISWVRLSTSKNMGYYDFHYSKYKHSFISIKTYASTILIEIDHKIIDTGIPCPKY